MRRVLLVTQGLADTVFRGGQVDKIIIEENNFQAAWLAGVRHTDMVIVAADASRGARVGGPDGRYEELMRKLRSFQHVFLLIIGHANEAVDAGLIQAQSPAVHGVPVLDWNRMGSPEGEVLAHCEAAMARAAAKRVARPFLTNWLLFALAALLALLVVASFVQPCRASPHERQSITLFHGDVVVPHAVRPSCNNTDRLRLLDAEMRSAFSIVQTMGSDPSLSGSSTYPMSVLEVATKNFHAHIDQAITCEAQHQAYEALVAEFHGAVARMRTERNVVLPIKCIPIGGREFRLPLFLSDIFM